MTRSSAPRATGDDDWARTITGVIDPMTSTVTVTMATTGRSTQVRTLSTGAGRVSHWTTS